MRRSEIRLLSHVISLEARSSMSYRVDFWLNVLVSFFAQLGVVWFLWTSIYSGTGQETIGGRDMHSMMLYYVLVILFGKVVRGTEHMSGISQDIYDGGLSRYLVYPTSYFRFKYAQHLGALTPAMMQLFLMAAMMPLLVSLGAGEIELSRVPATMAALALSNLLYFLLLVPVQAVAFWADNVWSLAVLMRMMSGLLGGSMLPLDLFPIWAQRVLDWLPFRYLFEFPVNTLTGRISMVDWSRGMAISIGWCLLLAVLSSSIWKKGDRHYTGVGI